jgi:hypothetical protein
VLVAVYAIFALSATARAGVQIATKFSHAPVAYLLSALAAVVYIIATVTLANGSRRARRIAVLSCSVELVGVLAVGTWSLADRATFPDATVWSGYGSGYGYVPLVLPVLGLLWLRYWTTRARSRRSTAGSLGVTLCARMTGSGLPSSSKSFTLLVRSTRTGSAPVLPGCWRPRPRLNWPRWSGHFRRRWR